MRTSLSLILIAVTLVGLVGFIGFFVLSPTTAFSQILSIALAVFILIITVGLIFLYRRYRRVPHRYTPAVAKQLAQDQSELNLQKTAQPTPESKPLKEIIKE
jgi:putative copper export protein